MALIYTQAPAFHRPRVKPKAWGPVSAVRNTARSYYEDKLGVAAPVLYMPFWEASGHLIHNYGTPSRNNVGNSAFPETVQCDLNSWAAKNISFSRQNLQGMTLPVPPRIEAGMDFTVLATQITVKYRGNDSYNTLFRTYSTGTGIQCGHVAYSTSMQFYAAYDYSVASITDAPAAGIYNYAWTRKNGATNKDYFVYRDGELVGSAINKTAGRLYYNSTSLLYIARYSSILSEYSDPIGALSLFLQNLTPDQIALEYDNPYAAIQPRSIPVYFFLGTAPSGNRRRRLLIAGDHQ